MAKIGTAQIEIKPVLNEEALEMIASRIEEAVAHGVKRGLQPERVTSHVTFRVDGEDIPATVTTPKKWTGPEATTS